MLYVPLNKQIEHSGRKISRHYPPENHRPLAREIRPFSDLSAHEESARKMLGGMWADYLIREQNNGYGV